MDENIQRFSAFGFDFELKQSRWTPIGRIFSLSYGNHVGSSTPRAYKTIGGLDFVIRLG